MKEGSLDWSLLEIFSRRSGSLKPLFISMFRSIETSGAAFFSVLSIASKGVIPATAFFVKGKEKATAPTIFPSR
ncbi:MAG: hypothetical protein BWY86_01232 [Candidatus Aminicenantes bacterium ADurb.Bin508]|nr:MAG: hypothetical protein BWY86_01232 [Candidatus Aminicenantes bacterium ADurb.Bin508]